VSGRVGRDALGVTPEAGTGKGAAKRLRLFVALELTDAVREALETPLRELRQKLSVVRWERSDKLHVTLQFLGAVVPETLTAIEGALRGAVAGCRPHALRLTGIHGAPAPHAPRMVWARLAGDVQALTSLRDAIGTALAPLGFAADHRPFQPHITVGRVARDASGAQRRTIAGAIARCAAPPGVAWQVSSLALFQSVGTRDGTRYVKRLEVVLGV
jgi:2'-5' RNA ligase